MRLVVIESPYAGDIELNLRYLEACIADCLRRYEAPFASHGLYPGILDDSKPDERALGIAAGLAWGAKADLTVVYTDLGVSDGMRFGIDRAANQGRAVCYRKLPATVWPPRAARMREDDGR